MTTPATGTSPDPLPAAPPAHDAETVPDASLASVDTPPAIPHPPPRDPGVLLAATEERVRVLEEQLLRARRLEMVGRLVAGVAHDFNNLLTVIRGNADLLRGALPAADPLRDTADLIAATAHTAAGVARQLLAFGKPAAADPCPVDPNAAVRAVERMLRALVGPRVGFDVQLAPGVSPIRVDPGRFDQVLLNLVANAADAIAGPGTVTLRTAEAVVRPGRRGWPAALPPGVYVALTVTDTGCGIPPDVQDRMFDPFFTTKGEDGTGLGLTTVREVVGGAGGHIEVESAPGWGTSVRVYWPRATLPPGPPPPPARLYMPGEPGVAGVDG